MARESKPVQILVVPACPPIDKYVAAKRVKLDLEKFFNVQVKFCDVNEPTPADYERWDAECGPGRPAILIDVGALKYHQGFQSATAMEKLASAVEGGREFNMLVGLINDNNQTGALKHHRHSVALLVRQAYHVMHSYRAASQAVVWEHGMNVVDSFFWRESGRAWNDLFQNPEFADLKQLFEGFGVTEQEMRPFTLPQYLKRLFTAGRPEKEIKAKLAWWLDKAERVRKRISEAEACDYRYTPFSVSIPGGKKSGGFVKLKGYFQARAFTDRYIKLGKLAVIVTRNELRQVFITTSIRHPGLDLEPVYRELSTREPNQWYWENRFQQGRIQILMNGSHQYTGVPPSEIPDEQIVQLLCKHLRFDQAAAAAIQVRPKGRASAGEARVSAQEEKVLGKLSSGEEVLNLRRHSLPDEVRECLAQALPRIEGRKRERVAQQVDFGKVIGVTHLLRTFPEDDIKFAKRRGKEGYTRFVEDREPEPCRTLAVVLKKVGKSRYELLSAYIGPLAPPEPGENGASAESRRFWDNHAWIWDSERVQPDTVTREVPLAFQGKATG